MISYPRSLMPLRTPSSRRSSSGSATRVDLAACGANSRRIESRQLSTLPRPNPQDQQRQNSRECPSPPLRPDGEFLLLCRKCTQAEVADLGQPDPPDRPSPSGESIFGFLTLSDNKGTALTPQRFVERLVVLLCGAVCLVVCLPGSCRPERRSA